MFLKFWLFRISISIFAPSRHLRRPHSKRSLSMDTTLSSSLCLLLCPWEVPWFKRTFLDEMGVRTFLSKELAVFDPNPSFPSFYQTVIKGMICFQRVNDEKLETNMQQLGLIMMTTSGNTSFLLDFLKLNWNKGSPHKPIGLGQGFLQL